MNKISVVLFFLFSSFFGVAQSEDNANHYFDRYEYAKAYKAYKEAGIDQMNADDVLKYIYSCYVIGDFKEVCNNIYKIDEIEGLDPFSCGHLPKVIWPLDKKNRQKKII